MNTPKESSTGRPPAIVGARALRDARPLERRAGRNRTKADLLFYELPGLRVAVKDYAARPWLVRQTLGRFLIRREVAAYHAAEGLSGIPRFLGRPGPFRLATEWLDARPLAELPRGALPERCFDRLDGILDELHARGIALVDLHHRDVLVGERDSVHVVDLAMAWAPGPAPGGLRGRLFERACAQDRVAAARMRARFLGRDVEAAVNEVGAGAAAWHRRGRRLKALLDRLRGRRRR